MRWGVVLGLLATSSCSLIYGSDGSGGAKADAAPDEVVDGGGTDAFSWGTDAAAACAETCDMQCTATGRCVECLSDADCTATGVCDRIAFSCLSMDEVLYVDSTMPSSGNCDSGNPCNTLADAIDRLEEGRRVIHLAPGSYPGATFEKDVGAVTGATITVIGYGATITPLAPDVPAVRVLAGASVVLQGIKLAGATRKEPVTTFTAHGLACSNSRVDAYQIDVYDNDHAGIHAVDCMLTLWYSWVHENRDSGVYLSGGSALLASNRISENRANHAGGILLGGASGSYQLYFNTVFDNLASMGETFSANSMRCNQTPTAFVAMGNIARSTMGNGLHEVTQAQNCRFEYSNVEEGTTLWTDANNLDQAFSEQFGENFALTAESDSVDYPGLGAALDGQPSVEFDYDLQPRVYGSGPDLGAHEFRP